MRGALDWDLTRIRSLQKYMWQAGLKVRCTLSSPKCRCRVPMNVLALRGGSIPTCRSDLEKGRAEL